MDYTPSYIKIAATTVVPFWDGYCQRIVRNAAGIYKEGRNKSVEITSNTSINTKYELCIHLDIREQSYIVNWWVIAYYQCFLIWVRAMVFNVTFKNISIR